MKVKRFFTNSIGLLTLLFWFSSSMPAQAISTSDFDTLFGSGSLVPMDFLGGATTGSIDISGGGIGGTVDFAAWDRDADDLIVLVYQIRDVIGHVDEFVVSNPFDYIPVDIAGGALTNAGGGLGYVNTDSGVVPTRVVPTLGAGLIPGTNDLNWVFGVTLPPPIGNLGTPIPDGGSSVRLYAAFKAQTVGGGAAELRDGVTVGNSPVVIPNPEPTAILLFGTGMVGLGLWKLRKTRKLTK